MSGSGFVLPSLALSPGGDLRSRDVQGERCSPPEMALRVGRDKPLFGLTVDDHGDCETVPWLRL